MKSNHSHNHNHVEMPCFDGNRCERNSQIIVPILIISLLLLSTFNYVSTIISLFVIFPLIIYFCSKFFRHSNPKTTFFLSWTTSSFVLLILIFEVEVFPYLEILLYENFILILFSALSFACAIILRKQYNENTNINFNFPPYNYNWWICVPIDQSNIRIYTLGNIVAILALAYGAHLTLTTVCHPYLLYGKVLVPDDCSEVYHDIHLGLCFSAAIYALELAICLLISLVYRLFSMVCYRLNKSQGTKYKILRLSHC